MQLKKYLNEQHGSVNELAKKIGVSASYLSQMSSGIRSISPARCVKIEQATNGAVTRKDLRPHDWHLIWTDLT